MSRPFPGPGTFLVVLALGSGCAEGHGGSGAEPRPVTDASTPSDARGGTGGAKAAEASTPPSSDGGALGPSCQPAVLSTPDTCDPLARASCATGSRCIAPVWGIDAKAHLFGFCSPAGALAGPGESCGPAVTCQDGTVCVSSGDFSGQVCTTACHTGPCGSMDDHGRCPSGTRCDDFRHIERDELGACAPACDLWSKTPDATCPPDARCVPCGADSRVPLEGCCVARAEVGSSPICGVCPGGSTCNQGNCVPECDVRAPAGHPGACAAGLACVSARQSDRSETGYLGRCIEPCDPWQLGQASRCGAGLWCMAEPLGGAPGSIVGECAPSPTDTAIKIGAGCGGDCPLGCPPCEIGSACVSLPDGQLCRRLCDPSAGATEPGSCPDGKHCDVVDDRDVVAVCALP